MQKFVLCVAAAVAACGSPTSAPSNTLAAATSFHLRIENVAPFTNAKTGSFAVKVGASTPGPLGAGDAYEVHFTAGPNHRLVFATMFGQSNDWFFATDPNGIALYDAQGMPIAGDLTSQVDLWDAGTEVDEEPAVGAHTGPNQSTSTDGPGAVDPNHNVRRVPNPVVLTSGVSFTRPAVSDMIRVTLTSNADTREFVMHVENVSNASTLITSEGAKPVGISPGVWALGTGDDPIFSAGVADRGEGLEALAEGGDISSLAPALLGHSGVATPLSPGVWVLHETASPLFEAGTPDRGEGLEEIAETGDITTLASSLTAMLPDGVDAFGTYTVPTGASAAGPIIPGQAFDIDLSARPGQHLSFAMMYGASNDWFFAPLEEGIALFDGAAPASGDVTSQIRLWDAGTELSEEPGIGLHIGPPVGAPDVDSHVREVSSADYATPVAQHLQATLSAL